MDSILDRVLLSKEDQEKQKFNPMELVNTLFKVLNSKEIDILKRRFGLEASGSETLETIGSSYGVTRERVRQIEVFGIKKIKSAENYIEIIKPVEHLIVATLQNYGGLLAKEMAYELLLTSQCEHQDSRQALAFLITKLFDDKIEEIGGDKKYLPSWKLKITSLGFVDEVIRVIESTARQIAKPLPFTQLHNVFQQTDLFKQNDQKLSADVVLAYVQASATIEQNPFEEYGLAAWGMIVPKRMNDRVYLVLQKSGKPMHFQEIAKEVARIFGKKAYPPTVHNELILNDQYVLVGRGIYALKEWGFKEGVVADILEEILRHADKPLTREELVQKVLEQRIVKKNTIHLALTDKTRFYKNNEGKYSLAKSTSQNMASSSNFHSQHE